MIDIFKIDYAITHSTNFHADDVFGVALLQIIREDLPIVRTINPTPEQLDDLKNHRAFVFDLGCQFGFPEYDHHQPDKALRPDGNPYCGFGLLWRDFGHIVCPTQKAWEKVDRDLVLPIDLADNGVEPSTLSSAIKAFNPTWDEKWEDEDSAFWNAEIFAERVLRYYIRNANSAEKAADLVRNSRKEDEGRILVLEQFLPWQDTVVEEMPEIMFVVYPSKRGGYCTQTVPNYPGSFRGRMEFPTRWLGHPDASLGMTFCHPNNFLCNSKTQENAINVASIAIKEWKGAE